MKPVIQFAIAIMLLVCFLGCDDKPAAPVALPPKAEAPPKAPQQDVPLIKPEYSLAIVEGETKPPQYSVTWSAKVNTGGWTMKTDNVLVEEYNGAMAARVYVTLEQPNPSETVTQAVETITGKYDAGATKIERVEFSVRQMVRGVNDSGPSAYSVVKNIKYPY